MLWGEHLGAPLSSGVRRCWASDPPGGHKPGGKAQPGFEDQIWGSTVGNKIQVFHFQRISGDESSAYQNKEKKKKVD